MARVNKSESPALPLPADSAATLRAPEAELLADAFAMLLDSIRRNRAARLERESVFVDDVRAPGPVIGVGD